MQIQCPMCQSTLAFPNDVAVVFCLNCNQKFSPKALPKGSYRGWLIAISGLMICFGFWLTIPIVELFDDSTSVAIGLIFFHMMFGTLVVIAGLVMSIRDKVRRGSKWIVMELILAIYVIYGLFSLTTINGIV